MIIDSRSCRSGSGAKTTLLGAVFALAAFSAHLLNRDAVEIVSMPLHLLVRTSDGCIGRGVAAALSAAENLGV